MSESSKPVKGALSGSDLHFIDGYIPTMRESDVIGHKFMGEVVEIGREAHKVVQ